MSEPLDLELNGDHDHDVLIAELRKLREEKVLYTREDFARLLDERDAALKRVAELEEANRILRNALTRQEEICMKSHWSGSGAKPCRHDALSAEHARVCNEYALLVQESGREGRELDRLEGLLLAWGMEFDVRRRDAVYAEAVRLAREAANG